MDTLVNSSLVINMENSIKQVFEKARKIVIKIGSNTLANQDGKINLDFMNQLASQCASLIKAGKQIVLVSSGAQVAGVSTIDRWARKKDIHYASNTLTMSKDKKDLTIERMKSRDMKRGFHLNEEQKN